MPRFFVRQPNGLLAEFSTIVDNFVAYDMTPAEAVASCEDMSPDEAREKVAKALADAQLSSDPPRNWIDMDNPRHVGLRRWHYCLEIILSVHGWEACFEAMKLMGDRHDDLANP